MFLWLEYVDTIKSYVYTGILTFSPTLFFFSFFFFFKYKQPINAEGVAVPPTPGGIVGRGYERNGTTMDDLTEQLARSEEEKDALQSEAQSLRARLS